MLTHKTKTKIKKRDKGQTAHAQGFRTFFEGTVKWKDINHLRPALPLDGNTGGSIPEFIINNASKKINNPVISPLKNPL